METSCPRWVLLNSKRCHRESIVAEAKDAVASCTSTGRWFHVSFLLGATGELQLLLQLGGHRMGRRPQGGCLDDSVLSALPNLKQDCDSVTSVTSDYFLYEAGNNGAGAPQLPYLCSLAATHVVRVRRELWRRRRRVPLPPAQSAQAAQL